MLKSHPMQLTVLGAGYVGLVTGACLAHLGHGVAIWEASAARRGPLAEGAVPFHEPGLQELLTEGLGAGRIRIASSAAEALAGSDLVLVCVGTPLRADGQVDMDQLASASAAIAEHRPGARVVLRSTLPLGSSGALATQLGGASPDLIATNPEFLRQGSAVSDFLAPTRIVVGTPDGSETPTAAAVRELYRDLDAPFIVTDFASAEMIKNAANAFLATKLSFMNEVADLCEAYGADVTAVMAGMGLDPRIGSTYLRPGIGFGGSCLPKELANMVRLGSQRGVATPLMAGAALTNDQRTTRVADRLEELLGPLGGCRVAVLGLSFKPDTDDLRYSPSLALIETLASRGAQVIAHDPVVRPEQLAGRPLDRADTPRDAIRGADLVVLATEWPAYRDLDWSTLRSDAARPAVYDGRNALDREALAAAGWRVINVGIA